MGTITSANSQFTLSIPDIFPTPIVVQGYEADDSFTQEAFNIGEYRMGVDGQLSAGYTPEPKKLTVMLNPSSASLQVFDQWAQAIESAKEQFEASAVIVLPSIGRAYNFSVGYLVNIKKLPDAKKTLQGVPYVIVWQDIQSVPIN